MYGRPKLIEFVRRKSPGLTRRDLETPSFRIFSLVLRMYLELSVASLMEIQLTASAASEMYLSMGRGEPPLAIWNTSPSLAEDQIIPASPLALPFPAEFPAPAPE